MLCDPDDYRAEEHRSRLHELRRAVDFFRQVQSATREEKIAVGVDHIDWLISAASSVVEEIQEV